MTNREALLSLAERVEALSGPCRETDALIWLAVTPGATRQATVIPGNDVRKGWTIDETREPGGRLITVPAYTASIDSAMSLVPQGWRLCQMNFSAPCADDRKWHLNLHGGKGGEQTFVGRGTTPARALTAASLRAIGEGL